MTRSINFSSIDPAKAQGPPIFIVGLARSGTTLLRLMLSAHPRIYICREIVFYSFEGGCSPHVTGEEFAGHFLEAIPWLHLDGERIRSRLPADFPRERTGLLFEEIMRAKAASYGRVRYGDK